MFHLSERKADELGISEHPADRRVFVAPLRVFIIVSGWIGICTESRTFPKKIAFLETKCSSFCFSVSPVVVTLLRLVAQLRFSS